jgi:SAM-dependent methyltransferase
MKAPQRVLDYWTSPESPKVRRYLAAAPRYETFDALSAADALFVERCVAPLYRGKTVLDFGAGPGRLVPLWTRHGVRLTSTDASNVFLRPLEDLSARCGQRAEPLDISAGALAETFDLVFSTQVLLHIHPGAIRAALSNMRAMAKRDLIVITWQAGAPYDGEDSTKVESFNHDYETLFRDARLRVDLKLGLAFRANSKREEKWNEVYYLSPT